MLSIILSGVNNVWVRQVFLLNHLFHIKLKQTFAFDSSMIRFGHFKPLILIFVVLASVPSNVSPGIN